jgi:hypothetical protein
VKLVITLRNGVQIKTGVETFTVTRNNLTGELRGIKWEASDDATASLNWLDLAEVVAIHAEHEPGTDRENSGKLGDER